MAVSTYYDVWYGSNRELFSADEQDVLSGGSGSGSDALLGMLYALTYHRVCNGRCFVREVAMTDGGSDVHRHAVDVPRHVMDVPVTLVQHCYATFTYGHRMYDSLACLMHTVICMLMSGLYTIIKKKSTNMRNTDMKNIKNTDMRNTNTNMKNTNTNTNTNITNANTNIANTVISILYTYLFDNAHLSSHIHNVILSIDHPLITLLLIRMSRLSVTDYVDRLDMSVLPLAHDSGVLAHFYAMLSTHMDRYAMLSVYDGDVPIDHALIDYIVCNGLCYHRIRNGRLVRYVDVLVRIGCYDKCKCTKHDDNINNEYDNITNSNNEYNNNNNITNSNNEYGNTATTIDNTINSNDNAIIDNASGIDRDVLFALRCADGDRMTARILHVVRNVRVSNAVLMRCMEYVMRMGDRYLRMYYCCLLR